MNYRFGAIKIILITIMAAIFLHHDLVHASDVIFLRVPVDISAARKDEVLNEVLQERQKAFVSRINKAKISLGIRNGDKVHVDQLYPKMNYSSKPSFMIAAARVGLMAKDLLAMNIEGISPSRGKRKGEPLASEGILKQERKQVAFIKRMNTAKIKLGFNEDESVSVNKLYPEMGLGSKSAFMNAAGRTGLKTEHLQAMKVTDLKIKRKFSPEEEMQALRRRHDVFIKIIDKKKKELGIKEGEKVLISVLSTKMGYSSAQSFLNNARRLQVSIEELRERDIVGIGFNGKLTIADLTDLIAAKKITNNIRKEMIDVIENVESIILDMTQGDPVEYTNAKDIQRDMDTVIKGIFEGTVFANNNIIIYNAISYLSRKSDKKEQLRKIDSIALNMKEIVDTINNYIFKLDNESLSAAIARFPEYAKRDKKGIDRDAIEQGVADVYLLEIIKERIMSRGNSILRKIENLNKEISAMKSPQETMSILAAYSLSFRRNI